MGSSIVRWRVISDTWDFADDIILPPQVDEIDLKNPTDGLLDEASSLAHWNVIDDIWNSFVENIQIKVLLRSNGVCYTFQDGNFVSIELTKENLANYGMSAEQLINSTYLGEKIILALDNPEIVTLVNNNLDLNLYVKGFRNVPKAENLQNPKLLILSQAQPNIDTKLIPNAQLIIANDDIKFDFVEEVLDMKIIGNIKNDGELKIIFSTDSGNTWNTINSDTRDLEDININNLTEIKNKGISIDTFNSIKNEWTNIISKNKTLRFAYYLEINNSNDEASADKLETTLNMYFRWKKSKKTIDYDYEYKNEKLTVNIYRDGGYKINYV